MSLTPAQFDKHLAGSELKPLYLLAGDEHLLLLEAADRLRARARSLGYGEREVLDAGSDFDWNRLAGSANALSLFAARRVIELRLPSGRPGTEGAEAIIEYCAAPAPDVVLLISTNTWSKSHETRWFAAVEKAGIAVVFWPLKRHELPDWMGARAAARGLALSADAVQALCERTEGHLLAAAQEIEKLALLAKAGAPGAGGKAALVEIDLAALQELVADHARFDVFQLAEAMLAGEAARAVRVLGVLRAEGEQVAGLVPWLAMQTQLACRIAADVAGGANVDSALRKAGVWASRIAQFRAAVRRGDAAFWESRYRELARVERMSKGREGGDAWLALERMVAAAADARTARAFAA